MSEDRDRALELATVVVPTALARAAVLDEAARELPAMVQEAIDEKAANGTLAEEIRTALRRHEDDDDPWAAAFAELLRAYVARAGGWLGARATEERAIAFAAGREATLRAVAAGASTLSLPPGASDVAPQEQSAPTGQSAALAGDA